METYHALTSVARPEQPTDDKTEQHAIDPVEPPAPEPEPSEPPAAIVNHTIEELAREGARRMLERALAVEVDEFLGRPRYERRMLAEHGYRNGYGRPRAVAIGTWPVEVRAPRIRDLPDDAPPFHSAILPRRRMLSAETQRLFARLYLEGALERRLRARLPRAAGRVRNAIELDHPAPQGGVGLGVHRLAGASAERQVRLLLGRRHLPRRGTGAGEQLPAGGGRRA